jgi:hypothetical protein
MTILHLHFPQPVNIHAQAYISAVIYGMINTERISTKLTPATQPSVKNSYTEYH